MEYQACHTRANLCHMRKVIFESAVSLDGFIQGPEGELDWLSFGHSCFDRYEFFSRFDTIFYGRKAYESLGVAASFPDDLPASQRQFLSMASYMRKYVFSRRAKHVAGNGMVINKDVEAEVKRIRGEEGKHIWLFGGADILKTFAALDLVDDYILRVHPVLLRAGKPLFEKAERPDDLILIRKDQLSSGVVRLHFRPESRINNQYHEDRSL
jgi:dihydrofolate reductase